MIKWLGNHVVDFIARFKSDVYLENISTGTIASGSNLGLNSNNKIVKATITSGSGDITSVVAGTGLSGGATSGAATLNVDAAQTQITSVGTIGTGVWQGTTIKTAYIGDDQVTEDKLANTLLAEIDANTAKVTNVTTNLTGTTHASQFRVNSSDGTNVTIAEASGSIAGVMTVAHHDKLDGIETSATADQSKSDIDGLAITTVGTIDTGVWNGTAIASAYLDTDTAHLSGAQTFTGTKTLNSFKGTAGATVTNILDEDAMGSDSATALATQQSIKAYANRPDSQIVMMRAGFKGDVTTTKYYIPLQAELEQTTYNHETNGFLAPFSGKLLKVMYRASGNLSGSSNSVTFRLEQIPRNVGWTTPTILETIAVDGPTNNTTDPNMVTADFVGGSGTNSFAAGDMIMVSMQHSADVTAGSTRHFFTLIFETDYTSLA